MSAVEPPGQEEVAPTSLDPRVSVRWPRRVGIGVAVVMLVLAAAFGSRLGSDVSEGTTRPRSPLIGRQVPEEPLPFLERDGALSLRNTGADVLVVNFWASWCGPCRQEHPALVTVAKRYEPRGVRFVGIVYQDRLERAVAFLDQLGRGYDHLVDPGFRAGIDFGVFGVPETFFVDRNGNIAAKVNGPMDSATLAATIEQILAGETPGVRDVGAVQSAPSGG